MAWNGSFAVVDRLPKAWRYALLGGLLTLPFTTLSYARTGEELTLSMVFWGGLLAGYLAKRRGLAGKSTGIRAGAVGGLPALWMVGDMVGFLIGLTQPEWIRAVQLVVLVLSLAFIIGLSAFIGGLGGQLGGWLAERGGHPRNPVTDTAPD
jgi:hypothetical protein